MKPSEKSGLATDLKAKSDQEVLRLTRQSHKLRNPRRRRRANTKTGNPKAPDWTLQEQALLGKMPDAEAAKRLGRTFVAVRLRRGRLGIPNYGHPVRRWPPEELELLGTVPDRVLARKLRRTRIAVRAKREQLRIPNVIEKYHRWRPEDDALLGQRRDDYIARLLGRSHSSVSNRRLVLGINFPNPRRPWPREELALLGTLPDAVLAKYFNRPEPAVRSKREQLERGLRE